MVSVSSRALWFPLQSREIRSCYPTLLRPWGLGPSSQRTERAGGGPCGQLGPAWGGVQGSAQFSLNICATSGTWFRRRAASCGRTDFVYPGISRKATRSPADEARPRLSACPNADRSAARRSVRCTLRENGWDVASAGTRNHGSFLKPWAGRENEVLCGF